jgi:signal transduction histidine kinase
MKLWKDELNFNADQLIDFSEQLRKQIAYDLHDSGKYLLLEIRMKIESIVFNYKNGNNILSELERLNVCVSQLGKKLNDIIEENDPLEVKDGNLNVAISTLMDRFTSDSCKLHFDKLDGQILVSNDCCLQVFRILQELITNIIKHNNAKNIYIDVLEISGRVSLVLNYDFFVNQLNDATEDKSRCRGLISIQQRLDMIQGMLDYQNDDENRRKEIIFSFPIQINN